MAQLKRYNDRVSGHLATMASPMPHLPQQESLPMLQNRFTLPCRRYAYLLIMLSTTKKLSLATLTNISPAVLTALHITCSPRHSV